MSYAITSQASCTKAVMMKCLCECSLCHLIIKHTYKCTLICMFVCMLLSRRRSRHCAYICTYICNWGISLTNTRTLRLCVCVCSPICQCYTLALTRCERDLPINMNGESLAFLANLLACAASSSSKKDFELMSITLLSFPFVNKLSAPLFVRLCRQVNNCWVGALFQRVSSIVWRNSEQVRCKVNNTTKQWTLSDNTIFTLSWLLLYNWLF